MKNKLEKIRESGAILEDPESLFVEDGVAVEEGARIGPQVILKGKTIIRRGAVIEGAAYLQDTEVGEGARLKFGVRAEGASIGPGAAVGPFAHLRPGSQLEEQVRVGNFVEVKNSRLKKGAKASHLTYLGDCTIGSEANIGAGVITCNYDGRDKHHTAVGDHAFIGSNSCLIAPISIGDGAVIGAGSVITKDIPPASLALTRAPLVCQPRKR